MAGKPKKPLVQIDGIIEVLLKYKDDIFHHGTITGKSFQVWRLMSMDLKGLLSPLALYTIVMKNRYSVWDHLLISDPVVEEKIVDESEKADDETDELEDESESEANSTDQDTLSQDAHETRFVITLTPEEYAKMRPEELMYGRKTKKMRSIFKPWSWSHILYRHFHEHTRLPCTLIFKKAIITPTLSVYATFSGKCKECNATLSAQIDQEPEPNVRVHVKCNYTGNYKQTHKENLKRQLSGISREDAVKEMTEKNVAPGMLRKLKAQTDMQFGGSEPKDLPTSNVLRVAKHQAMKDSVLSDNPVEAVYLMMGVRPYKETIRDLGYYKFRVFYWSASQIHVYRQYLKNYAPHSKVSIDETGGVVKRINRPWGERSGHIFLYEITVQEPLTHRQYSVGNMLSERHDSDSIHYWLCAWIRTGAIPPNECVTDMSLALLYGVARAFARCHSVSDYLQLCWQNLSHGGLLPKCYIRCDVAHVIKLMVQFPSLKKQIRRTRQFYLRALGQVIQCEDMKDMGNLLRAIMTIAISETEGLSLLTENPTLCEHRKQWLIARISTGKKMENLDALIESSENLEVAEPRDEEESVVTSPFQEWVKTIANKCKKDVEMPEEEGNRGNQQVAPHIIQDLFKFSRLLPMWTAVMKPQFGSANLTSTSAPVESSFSDLKGKVFAHCSLPLRVDQFLQTHIKAIDGAMKLASVNILDDSGNY